MILGWVTFTNKSDSDLDGQVYWTKQAQAGKYYPSGFTNETEVVGSAYALANGNVFAFNWGQIDFSEGNLSSDLTIPVAFHKNNVTSTNKTLSVTLSTTTGIISGSVATPAASRPEALTFKGAILQNQNRACGFFLGTNQSGRVVIIEP